jgi:general secretion pathway protein C
MQKPDTLHGRIADKLLVSASSLAALALLGCVLAYWTWNWLAPRAEPAPAVTSEAPRIESAYALFGETQQAARGGTSYALIGIAAASGGRPGHAVLRVDGTRTVVAREGDELAPGVRLALVARDHVVLDENGSQRQLEWPKPARPAPITQVRNP